MISRHLLFLVAALFTMIGVFILSIRLMLEAAPLPALGWFISHVVTTWAFYFTLRLSARRP